MFATQRIAIAMAAGLAVSAHAQTDIFWDAGSGVWNAPGNWSPVNVPNAANENAHILTPASAVVEFDLTTTIGSLEVGPQLTLSMNPATGLSLAGGVVNNGLVILNPTSSISNAFMQFNSSAMISGSGVLRLAGGGNDAFISTNGTTLTNALGHTIDGAGQIPATLINNGVISAIDTGFGNRLELISGAKTNNLNMQAGPGAELYFSGITVTQDPAATIAANSGGTVIFNSSNTVTGGRLVGTGAFMKPTSGNLALNAVSLESDLDVAASAGIIYGTDTFDCAGTITLNDSASINNAFIQFNASTTISGGGSFFLAGGGTPGGSNDSLVTTNGTTITIAPDFTIEGSGEVPATLINNGLVRAFPSVNGDGRLRLISGTKTNNGQLLADTGGTLEINGIAVNQSPAGIILADGGAIELAGSQTINGGTVRTVNGGTLIKPTSGNVVLGDVMLDADLSVAPSSGVIYTTAAFDCAGAITLNDTASANNAFIQFNANTTISGGGSFFLAGGGSPGAANDSQVTTNGTTITIAPDFTFEGSGELPATLINNGLVRAFPSANGDGRLRFVSGIKTNNSLFRADTGGVLEFNGVVVNQGPGGEILADGGAVEFISSQTVNGGTIRTANGGTLAKPAIGNLSLGDVLLDGDLAVAANAGVVYNTTLFACTGTIALNDSASGNNAFIQFNANTEVSGGGRFFLGGGGNDSQVTTNGTTLTIAPDFTVEGSGELRAVAVNNGVVRAFVSEFGDGRLRLISGAKANNGLMTADTDAVLEINGVTVTQGPDGELLADGGTVEFNVSQTVNGGTIRAANGGRLVRPGNGNLVTSGVTLDGDLELVAPSGLVIGGTTMTNNASVLINATDSANNAFVQFNGSTTVGGTGRFVLIGGGDDARISTNGTVATFGPGQSIEGEGQMTGSHIIQGRLAPGAPVGRITGAASITFTETSEIVAETTGPGVGDGITFTSGNIIAGGTVAVRLNGYVPAINDQFNLITAGSITGIFDDVFVAAGALPTNIAVRLVYTPNTVDVRFVCVADLSPPFGVLDLSDVTGFTSAFLAQDPLADLAEPIGVFDLADLNAFVANFLSNCN